MLSYTAGTQTYTAQNSERMTQFGPSAFIQEISAPTNDYPRFEYRAQSGGSSEFFFIFKDSISSPPIPTVYAKRGVWQQNSGSGADTRIRLDYFNFGPATPASSVPKSGIAKYRWFGTANYVEDGKIWIAQAYGIMDVNFAAGTIENNISLTGNDFITGNFGGLTGFTTNSRIVGERFGGPIQTPRFNGTGDFAGAFYGPNAEEVGLSFTAKDNFSTANGSIVGYRCINITCL